MSSSRPILVSIIIPHKNIPQLLQRCLDSIPTRSNIQVIVVDDNSDPNVVDFSHFPVCKCSNYEVYYDKTGKGAGRARNIGLEHVKGEWIVFADSDDRFEPGIEAIMDELPNRNEDIVYFDVVSADSQTLLRNGESSFFSEVIKRKDDTTLRYGLLTPWMKAVRTSLVVKNKIIFEETTVSNDTRFSALCAYYAKEVGVIPIVGYCWMSRSDSLWRRKDLQWYIVRFKVCLRIVKFMHRKGAEIPFGIFNSYAVGYLNQLEYVSRWEYLKYKIYYGIVLKKKRLLLFWAPQYLIKLLLAKLSFLVGRIYNLMSR